MIKSILRFVKSAHFFAIAFACIFGVFFATNALAASPSDCSSSEFFNPFTQSCVSCSASYINGRWQTCANGSLTCKPGYYLARINWNLGNGTNMYLFCQECPNRSDIESQYSSYTGGSWGDNTSVDTRCKYTVPNVADGSCTYTITNVPDMTSGSNCRTGQDYTTVSTPYVASTYGNLYDSYDLHCYGSSCESFSCDHIESKSYTYVPGNKYVTSNGTSNAGCRNCSSTKWTMGSAGGEIPEGIDSCKELPANSTRLSTGGWKCNAEFFLYGNGCDACPSSSYTLGTTSGLTGLTDCFLSKNQTMRDGTGTFTNNDACNYSGDEVSTGYYYTMFYGSNLTTCTTCATALVIAEGCSLYCNDAARQMCNNKGTGDVVTSGGYTTSAKILKVLSTMPQCEFYIGGTQNIQDQERVLNHGQ